MTQGSASVIKQLSAVSTHVFTLLWFNSLSKAIYHPVGVMPLSSPRCFTGDSKAHRGMDSPVGSDSHNSEIVAGGFLSGLRATGWPHTYTHTFTG